MAKGRILPVLPGIYVGHLSFQTRVAAVQAWDRDAVFLGGTAARLTWWPELAWDRVCAAVRHASTRQVESVTLTEQCVDQDLIYEVDGFRVAHPAWSALELSDELGGQALDEALRRGATSLPALRWALRSMPKRRGNAERHRLLVESRDEPWSELEREAHKMLRRSRITGWRANYRLVLPSGIRFLDIAFEKARLGVELDSWEHHRSFDRFQDDRDKDRALVEAGWTVLRFTHRSLDQLVPTIRRLLQGRLAETSQLGSQRI